ASRCSCGQLVIELADDRGEDLRCSTGIGGQDAQPFHVQQVTIYIGFLVEVESAGEVFQVRDVREIRLGESQDGEPAGHRVASYARRNDLQCEVPLTAEAEQVTEPVAQDLLAAHGAAQRGLPDDGPQLEPALGEPALPLLAQDDVPFRLVQRDVADGEHGRGVLLGLQKARYERGLVDADRRRGLLHPDVGLEPVRQDVVVPVPPAGAVSLLGQVQQLLALDGADAVVGEQIKDVDLADGVPAELNAADLGFGATDRLSRGLRGDSPALPEPAQLRAQQDAQHSGSLCLLWHDASRVSASHVTVSRNCVWQSIATLVPVKGWYPIWDCMPPPNIGVRPGRYRTHLSRDTSVWPRPIMPVKLESTRRGCLCPACFAGRSRAGTGRADSPWTCGLGRERRATWRGSASVAARAAGTDVPSAGTRMQREETVR